MPQTEWQSLISDCIEETLRIVDQAEDFVYDYMVPQLLESGNTAERKEFLGQLDMTSLKTTAPKLWARYSAEALNLVSKEQQAAVKALEELDYGEYKADRAFRPQVNPRRVFGLRAGTESTTTAAQGLDLPMGVFK